SQFGKQGLPLQHKFPRTVSRVSVDNDHLVSRRRKVVSNDAVEALADISFFIEHRDYDRYAQGLAIHLVHPHNVHRSRRRNRPAWLWQLILLPAALHAAG